jgi:hypothetical protein
MTHNWRCRLAETPVLGRAAIHAALALDNAFVHSEANQRRRGAAARARMARALSETPELAPAARRASAASARLRQGRARTAVRYPPTLQRRITTLVRQRRGRGGLTSLARALDLPRWTLQLWVRTPATAHVRAVALQPNPLSRPAPPAPRPVLITADGVRIEGASVEELTTLPRALR